MHSSLSQLRPATRARSRRCTVVFSPLAISSPSLPVSRDFTSASSSTDSGGKKGGPMPAVFLARSRARSSARSLTSLSNSARSAAKRSSSSLLRCEIRSRNSILRAFPSCRSSCTERASARSFCSRSMRSSRSRRSRRRRISRRDAAVSKTSPARPAGPAIAMSACSSGASADPRSPAAAGSSRRCSAGSAFPSANIFVEETRRSAVSSTMFSSFSSSRYTLVVHGRSVVASSMRKGVKIPRSNAPPLGTVPSLPCCTAPSPGTGLSDPPDAPPHGRLSPRGRSTPRQPPSCSRASSHPTAGKLVSPP
mmetsp:Transcript_6538/g.18519  ORF Transcript_6538/g.18519 Transcript_6538/m.18519 type:complete len:308 (-) Transcript_6538:925-1848(-)